MEYLKDSVRERRTGELCRTAAEPVLSDGRGSVECDAVQLLAEEVAEVVLCAWRCLEANKRVGDVEVGFLEGDAELEAEDGVCERVCVDEEVSAQISVIAGERAVVEEEALLRVCAAEKEHSAFSSRWEWTVVAVCSVQVSLTRSMCWSFVH